LRQAIRDNRQWERFLIFSEIFEQPMQSIWLVLFADGFEALFYQRLFGCVCGSQTCELCVVWRGCRLVS